MNNQDKPVTEMTKKEFFTALAMHAILSSPHIIAIDNASFFADKVLKTIEEGSSNPPEDQL